MQGFPKETPAAWKLALITSMERPYTRLNVRYSYEINASTGEVVTFEADYDD